jgi:hypothetical protein
MFVAALSLLVFRFIRLGLFLFLFRRRLGGNIIAAGSFAT